MITTTRPQRLYDHRLRELVREAKDIDEVYFGTGADIPPQLVAAKVAARQARLAANGAVRCQTCSAPVTISN